MRESRQSGSVEGVMGNHHSYSDSAQRVTVPQLYRAARRLIKCFYKLLILWWAR